MGDPSQVAERIRVQLPTRQRLAEQARGVDPREAGLVLKDFK